MIRVKLLAVLVGMIATLAVSAAPAFAEFQSNSTKARGLDHSGALVLEGGGATLECTGTHGTWTIFSGGSEATQGRNLRLTTSQWNGCLAKSNLVRDVQAKVKGCTLEFEQAAADTKANGSTFDACEIEVVVIVLCTIEIPRGQTGLVTNLLGNSGQSLLIAAEDAGIATVLKGSCPGISKTTNAKLKATFTNEGVKYV